MLFDRSVWVIFLSFAGVWADRSTLVGQTVPLQVDFTAIESVEPASDEAQTPPRIKSERKLKVVEGPWGVLEVYPIHVMAPDRYMDILQPESEATEWVFVDSTLEEIGRFLEELGVGSDSDGREGRSVRYVVEGDTIRIFPSDGIVRGLKEESRAKLAARLGGDERNPHYQSPVFIDSGDPQAWFAEAGVEESNVRLIASLCYRREGMVLFSDLPYVLSIQQSESERRKILRASTKTRALVARLNLENSADLHAVVDYWTGGYKRKALLPIFESISEVEAVERIDVAHLLPPLPRMLMYTYPGLTSLAQGEVRDCHWTSQHFFSDRIVGSTRYPDLAAKVLIDGLEPGEGEPQFGDTLIVSSADEAGRVIHSMTHIAGDIVFTKNGGSIFQPWVLMHLEDVLKRYSFAGATKIQVYRPRSS